jgi:hypothetical protein
MTQGKEVKARKWNALQIQRLTSEVPYKDKPSAALKKRRP